MISLLFIVKRYLLNLSYQVGRLFGMDKKTFSILLYHSITEERVKYAVTPQDFTKQIEKIARHSRFTSLDEALEILDGKPVAGPAVVLTLDDGYPDILKVLPVIHQYQIPAALFVLATPEKENRQELSFHERLLNWEELKYLKSRGLTIGCHSATHANFRNLTDVQIEQEIVNSKKILEEKLGGTIEYFAYPKGVYDDRIVAAVKRAGYKAAFGVEPKTLNAESDRWALPRVMIDKSRDLSDFPALYSPVALLASRWGNRLGLWKFLGRFQDI